MQLLKRHASIVIVLSLITLVTAACIVTTRTNRRAQPVYVEKHKPMKHKKHK